MHPLNKDNTEEPKKRIRFKTNSSILSYNNERQSELCEDRKRRPLNQISTRKSELDEKTFKKNSWRDNQKCHKGHEKLDFNGEKYGILKKIGGGSFNSVYEVFGRDRKLHALKIVRLANQIQKSVLKEVNLLTKLAIEPRIVRLEAHEVRLTKRGVMMLLQMEHGDCSLEDIFLQPKSISVSSLIFYWESILKCVFVLHSKNIIHLDIKPSNLF